MKKNGVIYLSFNPYFNGLVIGADSASPRSNPSTSFNPYFNGLVIGAKVVKD